MKKTHLSILVTIVAVIFAISACTKDNKEDVTPTPSNNNNTAQKSISKHWLVTNQNGRLAHTSEYTWFEFNANNKYIVAKADTFLTGDYTISSDGKTITMNNFGVITITSVSSTEFSFTLRLNGSSSDISIFTTEGPVISTSTNTELLCRTWKLVKFTVNDSSIFNDSLHLEVIFSKYGTYFMTYKNMNNTITGYSSNSWIWSDATETGFCYEKDHDSIVVCKGTNHVVINILNSTKLKCTESDSNSVGVSEWIPL